MQLVLMLSKDIKMHMNAHICTRMHVNALKNYTTFVKKLHSTHARATHASMHSAPLRKKSDALQSSAPSGYLTRRLRHAVSRPCDAICAVLEPSAVLRVVRCGRCCSHIPPAASHEAVRLSGVVVEGPLRTPAYLRGRGVTETVGVGAWHTA